MFSGRPLPNPRQQQLAQPAPPRQQPQQQPQFQHQQPQQQPATWEACKQQGNICFSTGAFSDAIQHYTRAIQHNAGESKLFSNRALCYLKLLRLDDCRSDAERAAELDSNNSKAYYLQGRVAFSKFRFERAVSLFKRGMELCCLVGDVSLSTALYGDLFNAYFVARRDLYCFNRAKKVASVRDHVDGVKDLILQRSNTGPDPQRDAGLSTLEQLYVVVAEDGSASSDGGGSPKSPQFSGGGTAGGLDDSLVSFQRPMEIPDCFLCPITLDIMRDPVILNNPNSGHLSYDRNALQAHFNSQPPGAKKDPISHDNLPTPDKWIIPNVSLRNAIHQYLEAHPWLYYGEIVGS